MNYADGSVWELAGPLSLRWQSEFVLYCWIFGVAERERSLWFLHMSCCVLIVPNSTTAISSAASFHSTTHLCAAYSGP